MQAKGFTLIELMIVVAVVAILAAVGYPSYREHIAKGQRSAGQQFLSNVAQRQEQFLLDQRRYAAGIGAGELALSIPSWPPADIKYDAPVFTVPAGAVPPTYVVCMNPAAGSNLALRNDGRLCINNLGDQWREPLPGDGVFDRAAECAWTNSTCRIAGEG